MNKQELYKPSILRTIQETYYNLKYKYKMNKKNNEEKQKKPHEKPNWYDRLCKKISNFSCHKKYKYSQKKPNLIL